jgi:predicted pyridoxine 5'-phosphate oxidase superfamily flavin-nucleotide-binding protein
MASLYAAEHRALQEEFGATKLAEFLDTQWAHDIIKDDERAFIQSRDMFFLSTVDPEGNPTVSYKGGGGKVL